MLSPDAKASSHRRRPSIKIEAGSFPSRTARARRSRELSRLVIIVNFTLEQFATETQRHGANLQAEPKREGLLANRVFALCISVAPWLHSFNGDLGPDRPVIGNIQRPDHAPTHHAHSTDKNPIRMKAQARASPRRRAGRKRCGVVVRLHQASDLYR